jgi:hypothetical protein
LQTLRAELRERVQSSVIVDHAGYGRNLIASLRQLVAEAAGA